MAHLNFRLLYQSAFADLLNALNSKKFQSLWMILVHLSHLHHLILLIVAFFISQSLIWIAFVYLISVLMLIYGFAFSDLRIAWVLVRHLASCFGVVLCVYQICLIWNQLNRLNRFMMIFPLISYLSLILLPMMISSRFWRNLLIQNPY